ncbi:MAG: response regulator [Acidimicrobiia bacterium]
MDPTRSLELTSLFHQELEERSGALVEAGRLLLRGGRVDDSTAEDAVRDAHTVKGSARLMGNESIAAAASLLEQAWTDVRQSGGRGDAELATALINLAGALGRTLDPESSPTELGQASARVERTRAVSEPEVVAPAESLGGLLSSVSASLLDGITRVDSVDLYRLINRLVEVALDASALADLALVSMDGADPKRVLSAWRSQLRRLAEALEEVQDQAVSLADVPFREATETFPQFIRYLGRKLGKDVRFEQSGENILLDRQIVEQLREPLRHLVVNAVHHGLEGPDVRRSKGKPATGIVSVHARLRDDRVQVSISDDGAGIDWKAVEERAVEMGLDTSGGLTPILMKPEFSTRSVPDDFSGTGEGLSVVADTMERIHGGMQIESRPDEGTTVLLTLPVSLVLQNMLVVGVGDQFWGIPEASVIATMTLADPGVELTGGGREMTFEGSRIPVVSLGTVLGIVHFNSDQEVVVLTGRSGLVAVTVPEIIDRRRVAVKDLGPILEGSSHMTAAAFLGGGEVLVVIDPNYLADIARAGDQAEAVRPSVLVVDDSAGVRQLIAATLSGAGFDVIVAPDAKEAVIKLAEMAMDVLVVDYSMPRSSGVDLVRALRAADVGIPIVMVSGVATPDEQKAAWEAGVDVYMDKFDLRKGVLTSTIRRLLSDRRQERV